MMAKKKAARKSTMHGKTHLLESIGASEPPRAQGSVTFRVLNCATYTVTPPSGFPAMAMYWEYVLRNRIRWAQDEEAARQVTARGIRALETLGLNTARLSEIAKAGVVQIDIPYTGEAIAWELRIFPWEFLLFSATAKERTGPLIVVRHVSCSNQSEVVPSAPSRLMVVESAPGQFGQTYSFTSEQRLVASNLKLDKVQCKKDPTLDDLKAGVMAGKPDVIHLAGFDTHNAEQFLKREDKDVQDGYLLADASGNPTYVAPESLADALAGDGSHRPMLVSCNFWNSAARVAALITAKTAAASIGFQDEIDDKIAENFFAKFYFNWRALDWDLLRAFRLAVRDIHFDGAVVVLWSAHSLIEHVEQQPLQSDVSRVGEERRKAPPQDISQMEAHEVLDLVIKLKETVNYSLLQNDENLFAEFSIRKLVDGPLWDIEVELMLYVGSDSFPYRSIFNTQESYVSLAGKIRFPLTSTLLRSLRESVNSVISIKVTWNGKPRYLNTQPVKLLAIDEWVDTPELDAYLPSFIFPRDRAIAKTIDSAQRYLMALSDDSGAGFDGYQGVDPRVKDPFATVDLQARAIWSALSYDSPLSYINPPPSFTAASQRLRTPSDVIDGKRGTCIDLALLMAACLEYAGIYPVIFLLNDHAFPGYWRSDKARQDFIAISNRPVMTAEDARSTTTDAATPTPMKPWVFTNYSEVVQLARDGDIVPIETVWLTQHKGFWDAVDEGMADLRSKREFGSMIDIQGARSYKIPITPLPILGSSS